MIRTFAAVVATADVCFAVSVSTGFASHRSAERYVTVRPGDGITVRGLDLFCSVMRSDPDHHEVGPVMYCNRHSARYSRAVSISRFHMELSNASGTYIVLPRQSESVKRETYSPPARRYEPERASIGSGRAL